METTELPPSKKRSSRALQLFSLLLLAIAAVTLGVYYAIDSKKEKLNLEIQEEISKILGEKTVVLDGIIEPCTGELKSTTENGRPDQDGFYDVFYCESGGFTVLKLTRLNDDKYTLDTYKSGNMGFKKSAFTTHSARYIDDFMGGKIMMDQGYKTKNKRASYEDIYKKVFEYFTIEDKKQPGAFMANKYAEIANFIYIENDYYKINPVGKSNEGITNQQFANQDWSVSYTVESEDFEIVQLNKNIDKDWLKYLSIGYGAIVLIFFALLSFIKR